MESLDLTTKHTIEINTDLSRRSGIHLSIIIDANVSDQYQQIVEDLPYNHSNVFIRVEEIITAQEDRDR